MTVLKIFNPATGEQIAEQPADDAASVADKARRARAAQPAWRHTPIEERSACVRRFRDALHAQSEALAIALTAEIGKPISQSRHEVEGLQTRIDFFVAQGERSVASETVLAEPQMTERISHEPLGVVANVSAWNYPYFVGGNVFVPALLTGNAVLYKPSEYATLTGLHIARLWREAGLLPDVFATLVGDGEVGAALVAQAVDAMFFTGSYRTGRRIAEIVGPRMIKMQLELGGKDPTYVREDVDIDTAARSVAEGAMYNTGQSCCSVERVYVHERIHDDFVDALVEAVRELKVGDPMDESTSIGPITRAPQIEVLETQVADALAKGAHLRIGGARIERPGHWFEPTVLVDVDHSMDVMREETFGPIVGVQRVRDDDEAIARMNDTRYGLTAGVYTHDEWRAKALLARLNAGSVYWNCCDRVSPRLPWSGYGDSGLGLTLSTYGIQTFTRPKAWHLRHVC